MVGYPAFPDGPVKSQTLQTDLSSEACLGYNRHHTNCFRTEFYQKQVGGVFDEGLP